MVRGTSKFEPRFVGLESLCSPSHSATSLPPTLWGWCEGPGPDAQQTLSGGNYQRYWHYVEPESSCRSTHTQLGQCCALQKTQSITHTLGASLLLALEG